ncbi:MAG: hypothetical protein ISS71_07885 [Phycisphaerae bacterium]|nr:hypothetical protein [Phycisphaerae bacterium]
MHWKVILILLGGCLFLISGAGFLFVKIVLRPKADSDLDDYHFEFEDHHPQLARYQRWSRITFIGVVLSMLMLFASMVF